VNGAKSSSMPSSVPATKSRASHQGGRQFFPSRAQTVSVRKTGYKTKRPFRLVLLAGFAAFALLMGIAGVVLYFLSKIPLPESTPPVAETTQVYFSDGQTVLFEAFKEENRIVIPFVCKGEAPEEGRMEPCYEHLPQMVIDAVIAREDRRYFEHPGIDLRGSLRALWADLRSKPVQGGSTIPQQYVKNVFVGSSRSLTRKIEEAVISFKLTRKYSKEDILLLYLNTIYFGRGAYGIEAAANVYFNQSIFSTDESGKPSLTVGQVATLAGMINNPAVGDRITRAQNNASITRRRDATLQAMVETGTLTQAEADLHTAIPLEEILDVQQRKTIPSAEGSAYFARYAEKKLVELYGAEKVYQGGLKVITTLDPIIQKSAEDAVKKNLGRTDDPDAAVVTLDANGRIVAMVGGKDFAESEVNLATGAGDGFGSNGRQPGSVFKPMTLAAAVDNNYSIDSRFNSPKTIEINGHTVRGGHCKGVVTLTRAMECSSNTVYVQLQQLIGTRTLMQTAKSLGVESELQEVDSLTLGSVEVSPLEMAKAYSVFANRGVLNGARAIDKVYNSDGDLLYDASQESGLESKRVLTQVVADNLTYVLKRVISGEGATGWRARIPGIDVAGKTGTTQNYTDAWFLGYSTMYTTAVWVGYKEDNRQSMRNLHGFSRVEGGTLPARVWQTHMSSIMEGKKVALFSRPRSFPGRVYIDPNILLLEEEENAEGFPFGIDPNDPSLPGGLPIFPFPPTNRQKEQQQPGQQKPEQRQREKEVSPPPQEPSSYEYPYDQ